MDSSSNFLQLGEVLPSREVDQKMYGISQCFDEHALFELDHGTHIDGTCFLLMLIFSLVLKDTVSCLAHALGAMNYSDRCILRLHDVVVTRKVGGRSDPSILADSFNMLQICDMMLIDFILLSIIKL